MAGEWIVAQVRGLYERKIATMLGEHDVPFYLPMQEVRKRDRSGVKRRVVELIFPNYLFVCARNDDDAYELVNRDGILRLIRVPKLSQGVLTRELTDIFMATQAGLTLGQGIPISKGDRCEVKDGPFKHFQGKFVRRANQNMMVLELSILGRDVPVEIDENLIELVTN